MANVGTRCFLRMTDDQDENARIVLDFVIMQLQQKTAHSNQFFESVGPDAVYTTRPWALVFVNETQDLAKAIHNDSGVSLERRQWLESIRVCQVESVHQLKAILCAMHIHDEVLPSPAVATGPGPRSSASSSDLLSWMQTERDNQPPCLIVVKDLLKWMATGRTSEQKELNKVLCLLVETCSYLSSHARPEWDGAFGLHTGQTTDLLVTDGAYLNDNRLLKVISYYCDSII